MADDDGSPFPLSDGIDAPYTTQVPDIFIDRWMAHMSGAEVKVLLYIIRRTFGFKKATDDISLNQIANGIITHDGQVLDEGTGLSQKTVMMALQSLEEKRVLFADRHVSPTKGNMPTTYRLNVRVPFRENVGRVPPKTTEGLPTKSRRQGTVVQETVNKRDGATAPRSITSGRRGMKDYTGGSYGVCPECLSNPHEPECSQAGS